VRPLAFLTIALLPVSAWAQQPPSATREACVPIQQASQLAPDGRALSVVFDSLATADDAADNLDTDSLLRVDQGPRITDVQAFQRLLDRYFPRGLPYRGEGGTTDLLLLVRDNGTIARVRVLRSSHYADLDKASVNIMEHVQLSPAMVQGCPVWAIGRMPFKWDAPPSAAPYGIPYGAQ
jgi:TonB family protein